MKFPSAGLDTSFSKSTRPFEGAASGLIQCKLCGIAFTRNKLAMKKHLRASHSIEEMRHFSAANGTKDEINLTMLNKQSKLAESNGHRNFNEEQTRDETNLKILNKQSKLLQSNEHKNFNEEKDQKDANAFLTAARETQVKELIANYSLEIFEGNKEWEKLVRNQDLKKARDLKLRLDLFNETKEEIIKAYIDADPGKIDYALQNLQIPSFATKSVQDNKNIAQDCGSFQDKPDVEEMHDPALEPSNITHSLTLNIEKHNSMSFYSVENGAVSEDFNVKQDPEKASFNPSTVVWCDWYGDWYVARVCSPQDVPEAHKQLLSNMYKKFDPSLFVIVQFYSDGSYSKVQKSKLEKFGIDKRMDIKRSRKHPEAYKKAKESLLYRKHLAKLYSRNQKV